MLDSLGTVAKSYDAVIIGSGHNGLVCANYLARRGPEGRGAGAPACDRRGRG